MNIDLRSDTVTKPSKGMLEAMMSAKIGDDVFEEDPTVAELENEVASIFGKEAGLFCPSGTMTNQIGIKIQSQPGQEIICDQHSHIYLYEGGGLAFNSGLSVALIAGDRGRLTAHQVKDAIRPDHVYYPKTALVSLENTHNRGGGSLYELQEIKAIKEVCDAAQLKLHLDGARIFNALAESPYAATEIGSLFNTISVCLSKGIGAPVGSVLVADKSTIYQARRIRKVMGGGMRQAGFLAAACLYGIRNNVAGLKEDHRRARILGDAMSALPFVDSILPVSTNIIVSFINNNMPLETFLQHLAANGIKAVPFGPQAVRMVTHLDFDDTMLEYTLEILKKSASL